MIEEEAAIQFIPLLQKAFVPPAGPVFTGMALDQLPVQCRALPSAVTVQTSLAPFENTLR
jgi:hypothetical protein